MSSPPEGKLETKAGHPPAVKAGGMRIVQKHPHSGDTKEEKDKDDQEWESPSPPKPTVFISGVIARLNRILFDTNTHSGQVGVGFPWNKGGDLVPSPPSAAAPGSHEVRKPQASFQEGAPGATLGTPAGGFQATWAARATFPVPACKQARTSSREMAGMTVGSQQAGLHAGRSPEVLGADVLDHPTTRPPRCGDTAPEAWGQGGQ
ncbi:death-associated protein 1 isoform X2 [Ursus maritimus]|uniref:Death-associated protein 1 isoform X2 n=1 Tax=Ursus maritimus TaxID=29073 RepID=A0A8M1FSY5_URSMA|nr:death-associated protein 1 isoform X2 [Ursus maritimus]